MTISSISYSGYNKTMPSIQSKSLKGQDVHQNQIAFRGAKKVITETANKQGKKFMVAILATLGASITALVTKFRANRETQKEKKEFDRIFRFQEAPRSASWKIGGYTNAEFTINGHFVEIVPSNRWVEQNYLNDGDSFKEWAFNTIREYRASGQSIEEFASTKSVPLHVKKLLKAYETPKSITAHELLPNDIRKMQDRELNIEVGDTTFEDSTNHPVLVHDFYRVKGDINGMNFELSSTDEAFWPSDKELFTRWATSLIKEYEKSGLMPYKFAEKFGMNSMSISSFLRTYERNKENRARAYFKELIIKDAGISRERIDAYIETLPYGQQALALQDMSINGKNSPGFMKYEKDLEEKFPEIMERFKEKCRFIYYKGDPGVLENAYPESIRPLILKAYSLDPIKGEKILEILFGETETWALHTLERIEQDPSYLDKIYNEKQSCNSAYVPMKNIEYRRLDTERMLLIDELYHGNPDKARQEEIIDKINDINSKIKGGHIMTKTIENPNNPYDTYTHVLIL